VTSFIRVFNQRIYYWPHGLDHPPPFDLFGCLMSPESLRREPPNARNFNPAVLPNSFFLDKCQGCIARPLVATYEVHPEIKDAEH